MDPKYCHVSEKKNLFRKKKYHINFKYSVALHATPTTHSPTHGAVRMNLAYAAGALFAFYFHSKCSYIRIVQAYKTVHCLRVVVLDDLVSYLPIHMTQRDVSS
jgi:hypothetical protein